MGWDEMQWEATAPLAAGAGVQCGVRCCQLPTHAYAVLGSLLPAARTCQDPWLQSVTWGVHIHHRQRGCGALTRSNESVEMRLGGKMKSYIFITFI